MNQKIEKLLKENEAVGDENTRLKKKVTIFCVLDFLAWQLYLRYSFTSEISV